MIASLGNSFTRFTYLQRDMLRWDSFTRQYFHTGYLPAVGHVEVQQVDQVLKALPQPRHQVPAHVQPLQAADVAEGAGGDGSNHIPRQVQLPEGHEVDLGEEGGVGDGHVGKAHSLQS